MRNELRIDSVRIDRRVDCAISISKNRFCIFSQARSDGASCDVCEEVVTSPPHSTPSTHFQ